MNPIPEELEIIRELQPLFKEKMGHLNKSPFLFPTERGDMLYNKMNKCVEVSSSPHQWHSMFLAIPDLYSRDRERPERGLFGMLRKDRQYQLNWNERYLLSVYDGKTMLNVFDAETPYLALLRAIKWQEEQKR
jgi:hypothetical protein